MQADANKMHTHYHTTPNANPHVLVVTHLYGQICNSDDTSMDMHDVKV